MSEKNCTETPYRREETIDLEYYTMENKGDLNMEKWRLAVLVLAAAFIITGVLLMFDGKILGDRTTGIATIVGLAGMFIFVTLRKDSFQRRKRKTN